VSAARWSCCCSGWARSRVVCADILHLVAAVRGAVNGLLDEIVVDHLDEHVAKPGLSDGERAKGAEELLTVIRRYVK
jgi:DNA-binding FrmR family transcriptional regulator